MSSAITRSTTWWRWPAQRGELPAYITQGVRTKTFLLFGLQIAAVLGISILVESPIEALVLNFADTGAKGPQLNNPVLVLFAFASVAALVHLQFLQHYPLNYVLLVAVTVLVGCFWASARLVFDTWFHYEVLGILCVTMLVAACISASTVKCVGKVDPFAQIFLTLLPGWLLGSLVAALVMEATEQITPKGTHAAIGLTSLLLVVIVCDTGGIMARGNPDDFMRVVVHLNWALLMSVDMLALLVVLPICCFCRGKEEVTEEGADQPPGVQTLAV